MPGSRVGVGPDGPIPAGTLFRWTQVEGPPVAIDDPTAPKIHFTAPAGAKRLAFNMSVRGEGGEKSTRIMVPIVSLRPVAGPAGPSTDAGDSGLLADGGDDQVGLVGRRITLNGTRSRPIGQVGYRWIPLSGPSAADGEEDGGYYSFSPTAAGVYRFALVVALESRVSRPDVVTVEVGQPPTVAPSATPSRPNPTDPSALPRAVASAVAAIPRGVETADQVADVFESLADRSSLYKSYGEIQSELTRRLDVIIPGDPATRAAWSGQVLVPLSQITSAELMAAGIDPRAAPEASRPLEPAQKQRIQAIFKDLATAFRQRTTKP